MTCTNRTFNFTDNGDILYRIILLSVICSGEGENAQQTWTYSVQRISSAAQNISNWALELCPNDDFIVLEPGSGIIEDPNEGQVQGNCLSINNEIGCFPDEEDPVVTRQIKWETSGGTFSFTLQGCYQCQESHVAIKAGNECFCGMICGPSCTPGTCEPPTRGVIFS